MCECEIDLSSISEDRMFHTQRQNWLSERRLLRTCGAKHSPRSGQNVEGRLARWPLTKSIEFADV